jgi:hypothetical protein
VEARVFVDGEPVGVVEVFHGVEPHDEAVRAGRRGDRCPAQSAAAALLERFYELFDLAAALCAKLK